MTWRDVGVFRNYIGVQQFSTCKLPVCRAKRPGYDDNLPPGSLVPDIAMVNENDPYGGSDRGSTAYSDAAGRPRPKKARSALLLAIVVIFVLGVVVTLFVWPKETADPAAKGRAENPAVIGAITVSEMHFIASDRYFDLRKYSCRSFTVRHMFGFNGNWEPERV
jgi:hypothetical protein